MVRPVTNQTSNDFYATASFVAEDVSRFRDSWRIMKKLLVAAVAATFLLLTNATAQVPTPAMTDEMKAKCGDQNHSTYLLGPGDQLQISDPELTELANKPVRVDGDGSVDVPLAGRVHVGGLTAQQGQQELNKALSTYIRHPRFIVEVSEVHSQPVFVLGAVNTPGVHQVQGRKTLLENIGARRRHTTGRGLQRAHHS